MADPPNLKLDRFFDSFPVLTTPRLRLRDIRRTDLPALHTVFSDPEAMAYYGPDVPTTTHDQTLKIITDLEGWYAGRHAIRWAITFRDRHDIALGTLGVFRFDDPAARCEVGYELGRAHWQQGIMSEALRAVIEFCFFEVGFRRIEAGMDGGNPRSSGLLRRLGFQHEACFRERLFYKGRYWDEDWFALLRAEYQPN